MGTTLALPLLDAMVPALSARAAKPTPRLGFVYVANGVIQNQWNPATTGAGFELTPILQPLASVRDQHQRPERPVAPAGRHVRRRHRRSSARLGRVADRRARLRPHAARRRGASWRPPPTSSPPSEIGKDVAHSVARAGGRLPDAGRLRLGRLLLRQHGFVAQRDDAEPDRVAPARRVRAAVRRRRQRRRSARRAAQTTGSILDSVRARSEPPGEQRSARGDSASSASISTRCARSSSASRTPKSQPRRHRAARAADRHSRRRSTSTPS